MLKFSELFKNTFKLAFSKKLIIQSTIILLSITILTGLISLITSIIISPTIATISAFVVLIILLNFSFIYLIQAIDLTYKQKEIKIKQLCLNSLKQLIPVVITILVVSILVNIGFVLFIIPGIILTIFLNFSILEKILNKQDIFASLKSSWSMVKGNFWSIFKLRLIMKLVLSIFFAILISILIIITKNNYFILMFLSIDNIKLLPLFLQAELYLFAYLTINYLLVLIDQTSNYLIYRDIKDNLKNTIQNTDKK